MKTAQPAADLRLPGLAAAAWTSAVAAQLWSARTIGLIGGAVVISGSLLLTVLARDVARRPALRAILPTALAWLLVSAAVAAGVVLRDASVRGSPVAALARDRATVTAELVVTSDPRQTMSRFGSRTIFTARVESVQGRGHHFGVRAPVLVFGPIRRGGEGAAWAAIRYGARLDVSGRLGPSSDDTLAGLLSVRGPPEVLRHPGRLLGAAASLRAGIRAAVAGQPAGPRSLVPALVDGDDTGMAPDLQADFKTTGLTHLLAVSGTNLTLVVGFLLVVARGLGVRARGLIAVGACGVVGFVLLTRAEPSVLRAAVMGSVALVGMGAAGRARGTRALGACVVGLMLFDPWLALSAGFALSALATAGILFFAPPWRDALAHWLPRWLAEAIAVPLAAQLACTPIIAAISGQVSLVAVAANMLAAVAVGPATVLGLVGGSIAVVSPFLGRLVAAPGAWSAGWIIWVARHAAALPEAAGQVPTGPIALTVLTILCLILALALGAVLAHRTTSVSLCLVIGLVMAVPLPTPGWPPRGWVLVACDVGQGDGLVLRASADQVVVVDTGPDPRPMDACLRSLGVHRIALVVLTHFHADHVDGLPGVLKGRRVGGIEVSPYADPAAGATRVHQWAAGAHVAVVTAQFGEVRTIGALHWQVVAPSGPASADSDSAPNDDSVVLYIETLGIRILMMGDEETGSQERLHAVFPGLRADVLKVAHHGSAKQDPDLVRSLGARIGLVSEGKDNGYGHPAPSTMSLLRSAGIRTFRTETDGSIAVVVDGGLRVVTHR